MPLTAAGDVVARDGLFIAANCEPWLDLGLAAGSLAGHWIEVTYRASLLDEPSRPVFRFHCDDGSVVDRIGAAPIVGAGVWTGRVPSNARSISVSPTNRPGPFGFAIEQVRRRWWPVVLVEAFRQNRKPTRSTILTKLIGWTPESDVNLTWATASTPLAAFDAWRAKREQAPDLGGFDRQRFDWTTAAPIRLVVLGDGSARTIASLNAQIFDRWRICKPEPDSLSDDDGLVGVVRAGDRLPPTALAYLAEQAARRPDARLFYGDRLVQDASGNRPDLKPGWCPRLQQTRPYIESAVFVRGLGAWRLEERRHFLGTGEVPATVLAGLSSDEIVPLRRIMIETSETAPEPPALPATLAMSSATAAIIIPTRDHPDLLRRVVASIRAKSSLGRYMIVVVDNGSVTEKAKRLHAAMARDDDVVVIDHPGPFNFSAMCNEAAVRSHGDVLVFLNDDTEVLSQGWLDRLVTHASEPAVGAVGAKLTYPDGRLQHVGVVVGMGESAGHFGALAPGDDPGWADRNLVAHEVSAVTGACLAVARDKFDAVGGFDATHLPIELSDIDLCLKLNARGWQTIVDPSVHLMHEESVSRGGATLRRLDVHGAERDIFITRWRHVLRDDPTFHPGLSLYSWRPALG